MITVDSQVATRAVIDPLRKARATGFGKSKNRGRMKTLYCTADAINQVTGGGHVTTNELLALKELGEATILSAEQISPGKYCLPNVPFLSDYLAATELQKENIIYDVAHFYSGTFSQTIRWLRNIESYLAPFITYTCPAHDRTETIEEHQRMGYDYAKLYPHIADDRLFKMFTDGLRMADQVIAPSRASANYLSSIGCQKVTVIPHGCNPPENVPRLPDEFNVGYMGQIGIDKGLVYFLKSWAKLNYRDSKAFFAGCHPNELSRFLNIYAGAGKFAGMGFVEKLEDFYSQISVYVMPSVCESFSITVLEAMSFGRPVICSDGAGVSDLITDGREGFVIKKRDPDAIAERIDWFKHNREKIAEMGQLARKTATKFTWENIRKLYVDLWEKGS